MNRQTFVIISVGERVPALNALVDSILQFPRFQAFDLNLMFTGNQEQLARVRNRDRFRNVFVNPERTGCHAARVDLLRRIRYGLYVNLDDDMVLTRHTNYDRALAKVCERPTGFVLTNWARTEAQVERKAPKLRPEFVKQALVYQGGGMAYRDEVADLMRALPMVKQTFDHAWPLTAYVNGYTNYRDLSSLAVHRIMGKGGMSAFMDSNPPQLLMREYVTFRWAKRRRGNGHDVLIPLDQDLTPLAHAHHKANKR